LPKGAAAVVEYGSWPILPIFKHLQSLGNVPQDEMLRTFNMGAGMVLVVPSKKFKKAQAIIDRAGEKCYTIGRVVKGDRKVMYS
jgi:phosphoribosylformylglycinamidine cyclo-ligase